ncbi:MAG: hypothetical protein QNK05_20995 [Myxococcota bacterium]|nr:hypothetical protein [Myxococcota bacterium]
MTLNALDPVLVVDVTTETIIPFDFSVATNDDLLVLRDGNLLTRTVDYQFVAPATENNGSITLVEPVQAGRYALVRSSDRDQLLDLAYRESFPSELIEATLDKLVRRDQEQQSELDRSILRDLFDSTLADAKGLRIANVADPVDDQDAVTKTHMEQRYATLPPGAQGPAGPAIPGPPGTSGPQGDPLPWLVGSGTPNNNIGIVEQLYLDSQNGDAYQKQVGGWVFVTSLRGPAGTGGGGGVTDHGSLTGLTDPDHPISAVAGLQNELDTLTSNLSAVQAQVPVVYFQDDAPTGTIATNSLWFDTNDDNRQYYYDGLAWVDVRSLELDTLATQLATAVSDIATAQATADGKIETFVGATEPGSAALGDLWLRTSDNRLHRYDGTNWVGYQDASIVSALTNAANAQATADGKIVSFYQPQAPTSGESSLGDLWTDTDDNNHLYRYNGANWISIRDANIAAVAADLANAVSDIATLQGIADGYVDITYAATGPGGAALDDLWIDSGDNQVYRWNGSAWESIRDNGIAAAVSDSANALSLADEKIRVYYQNDAPDPGLVSVDTGDLWVDLNDDNHQYRYNGSAWVSIRDGLVLQVQSDLATAVADIATLEARADGFVDIFYASSAPTANGVGDIWIDSDDNQQYRWDGSSWVSIQDNGLTAAITDASNALALADEKIRAFYQNDAPNPGSVTVDTGDLWYDTNDNNKPYRYSGVAWVEVAPVNDLNNGQIGGGGLQANSVSIQTEATNQVSTALVSNVHASDGAKIQVRAQFFCELSGTAAFNSNRWFTGRIRRRLNSGVWTTVAQVAFANDQADGFPQGVADDSREIGFGIDAINNYKFSFSSFRGDTGPEVPPFFIRVDADVELYDNAGVGDVEYEAVFTLIPDGGGTVTRTEQKRIDTLEIKR